MAIRGLFFFIFLDSIKLTINKICYGWILTGHLWCRKLLLYQLSLNHCPFTTNFSLKYQVKTLLPTLVGVTKVHVPSAQATSNYPWGAAIAQWICLCLPSCRPGFESQVRHLCFFIYSICATFVM